MIDFLLLLGCALTGLFRSRARLEAEILVLRQQINVLRPKSPKRPAFSNIDRLLLVWLSRLVPTTLEALTVVRPTGGATARKRPRGRIKNRVRTFGAHCAGWRRQVRSSDGGELDF